jgi:hypothetical protein
MTIKLGGMSDYNGYYLIDNVSFPDISPDPVSISFKKPQKEDKEIKDLPIGERGPQVIDITDQDGLTNRTMTYDVTRAGSKFFRKRIYKGIFPLPDADHRFDRYPTPTAGVFATGNMDIYDRPVLVSGDTVKTTHSITIYPWTEGGVNNGKPFSLLLTPIWTSMETGMPVELTQNEAIAKYQADGRFLAKVRGKSKKESIYNAGVYGALISGQQHEIVIKKFPNGKYVNTPGSE